MRLWSSLLLVAFSGVLAAAPATRLPRAPEQEPRKTAETETPGADAAADSDGKPGRERHPRRETAASRMVVLRDSNPGDEPSGAGAGGPPPTFSQSPVLRPRKLRRARPGQPAALASIDGADLRAGLIATPPPAA